MGLFDKKPMALAIFGNNEAVKALVESKIFDSYGINLMNKDFVTIDELLAGIAENKNTEYVLISDAALIGMDNGKKEIIKRIREKHPDIFIAMFMNYEKYDDKFIDWAFGYKVYNIYYAMDESGSHNFNRILPEIAEKSMPTKHSSQEFQNAEADLIVRKNEISAKEQELSEREQRLRELEAQLKQSENTEQSDKSSAEIEELREKIRREKGNKQQMEAALEELKAEHALEKEKLREALETEKKEYKKKLEAETEVRIREIKDQYKVETEKPSTRPKTFGCITIGVFNLSHGAGATYTAIKLSELFAKTGLATAVIAYDNRKDLLFARKGRADYYAPNKEEKKGVLLDVITKGYEVILIDFGNMFPVLPTGAVDMGRGHLTDSEDDIAEFLRCHYKIGIGFSSEWHIKKVNFFSNNAAFDPYTSIFCIEGIEGVQGKIKSNMVICERDNDLLFDILCEWLAIKKEKETPERKRVFGRKAEAKGEISK